MYIHCDTVGLLSWASFLIGQYVPTASHRNLIYCATKPWVAWLGSGMKQWVRNPRKLFTKKGVTKSFRNYNSKLHFRNLTSCITTELKGFLSYANIQQNNRSFLLTVCVTTAMIFRCSLIDYLIYLVNSVV